MIVDVTHRHTVLEKTDSYVLSLEKDYIIFNIAQYMDLLHYRVYVKCHLVVEELFAGTTGLV